jgi:hypothetical protein
MKFNAKTLDAHTLLNRARTEAKEIYSSESTRRGRSLDKIVEASLYGLSAEVYLIEEHSFVDDTRKYKDLYDTEGNSVEIKVTQGDYYVPYVLDRANKAKSETWRGYPDILYVFIGNKKTLDYELYNIYAWNSRKFVVQTQHNAV